MNALETRPALYVGTYGKYNDGSIAGKWLYLDDYDSPEAFYEACKELHKDEDDPEYMFQDFEGFPEELYSESGNVDAIYSWVLLEDDDKELVTEYMNATGDKFSDIDDIEEIRDRLFCELDYTHSVDDNNAMGDYIVDNGLIEVPDNLRSYIDYQALGRDWLMDMNVSSNGWVFTIS